MQDTQLYVICNSTKRKQIPIIKKKHNVKSHLATEAPYVRSGIMYS